MAAFLTGFEPAIRRRAMIGRLGYSASLFVQWTFMENVVTHDSDRFLKLIRETPDG